MKSILAGFGLLCILMAHMKTTLADSNYNTDYWYTSAGVLATIGPVGGVSDVLEQIVVIPTTATVGSVTLFDGTIGQFNLTVQNPGILTDIKPIVIPVHMRSKRSAWRVLSSAGAVISSGKFK